eukprot:1615622-Pleurochrysis_carterae.AAC.1
MPAELAMAASARREVGRMVAQKARFECPAAFALVNPDESDEGAVRRHIGAIDSSPAAVSGV